MDEKIENTDNVIFIVIQKAIEYFKNVLSRFIEEQSKEYYLRCVDSITASFPNYTCEQCGLSSGASNASVYSGNELCSTCKEKLIHLITVEHLSKSTNLSNIKWTDIDNISWQLFKFYIDDPGHIDTSSARAAGINALFQICMNHVDIKRVYGDELCLVKEMYDGVLQSRAGNFSEELCQRLIRILRHEQHVTRKDELKARKRIIQDLKTQIAVETAIGNCNCNEKLSNLTVSLGIHQRSLKTVTEAITEEFRREESKLQEEQTVVKNKQDALKKKKDIFNKYMTEVDQFPQQTTVDNNTSVNKDLYNSANERHTLTLVADMHGDVKELINGKDGHHNSILNLEDKIREIHTHLVNKIPWIVLPTVRENTELTLKLYPTGCENYEVICNNLITAGQQLLKGEMPTDLHSRHLHHLLQTILAGLQDGGNQIRNITHGCVAIHIACPTLTNLIALCEKYFNGRLTELLQPLQDYLRTLPGCKDVIILPIIFERDYLRCIMKIVTQVEIALTKRQISSADVNLGTLTEAHECTMVQDTDISEVTKLHDNIKCNLQPREVAEKEPFEYYNSKRSATFNESDEQCVDMRNEAYCNVSSENESPNSQTANTNLIRDMLQNIFVPSDIPLAEPLSNLNHEIQCNGNRHTGIASKDGEKDETYVNGIVPTYTLNEDKVNNFGTSNVEKREIQSTQSGSEDESCSEKHVHEKSGMTLNILEINGIKETNSKIQHGLPATYHESDLIEASGIREEKSHQPGRVPSSINVIKAATSDICLDIEGDTCDKNLNEVDGFEIIRKRSDDYEFIEKDMFTTNEQNCDVNTMCIEQQIEDSEYERSCKEFSERLKKHYSDRLRHVTISPLDEQSRAKLADIYMPPKLFPMCMDKGTFKKTDEMVTNYADLLYTVLKNQRRIFIQGDAGSGKTTFLAKLVLDWMCGHKTGHTTMSDITVLKTTEVGIDNCTESSNRPSLLSKTCDMLSASSAISKDSDKSRALSSSAEESDVSLNIETIGHAKHTAHMFADLEILQGYTFVFHIILRNSVKEMDVFTMIKKQIIDSIYCNEIRENAYRLVNEIMKRERCLVLLDGLDEWTGPGDHHNLPTLVVCHRHCVILITTRPWKLTEGKIKHSDIDALLQLEGINEPFQLSRMILRRLVHKEEIDMKYSAFKHYIGQQKLDELLLSPMMLSAIACSYAEGTELKGSKCEIYTILLESLFKKASSEARKFQQPPFPCFTETQYIQSNIEHVNRIADVAFHLLFLNTNQNSQFFRFEELKKFKMDEREDKKWLFKSGILTTRRNSLKLCPASQFMFLHMSIQEFFAAYHIARNTNLIDAVISGYLNSQKNAYLDISMVFTFLCGLDISAGNRLSIIMNARVPADALHSNERKVFQDIILAGYREALANKQTAISLKLSHFYFDEHNINLYSLWINNAANALSLEVKREMNMLENRRISPASDESASHMKIYLSSCRKLKSLHILGNDILLNDSSPSATLDLPVWIVLNSGDPVQCTDPFPVLPSIELIKLTRVTCYSTWLRSLFSTLLTLDHKVKCELENCKIISGEEGEDNKSYTDGSVSITTSINKTFALCLDGDIGPGLWEVMNGLNIKSLSLLGVWYGLLNANRVESLSQLLSSLMHMEALNIAVEQDFKVNHERSLSQSLPSLRHLETLSINAMQEDFKVNHERSLSQSLPSPRYLETLSINAMQEDFKVNHERSLSQSLRSLSHLETLSINAMQEYFKVNHEKSLSQSLRSLSHLETLSISVSEDSSGLWETFNCPDIKSLWDSYECLNVNHTASLSQSLSSFTQLETLSNRVYAYSPCLWEALRGLNIKRLSLLDQWGGLRVNHDESLSKSLSSLKHLEMLGLYVHTYTGLQLPQSLKHLNIYCDTLRPSKLSALLNPLLACTQTIEIKLEFGWTSYDGSQLQEYIQIQQELGARKNVIVQRFRIYDLTRDIGCVDGDAYNDLCYNDNLYKTFAERMDVCKTHRISIRLKISPDSI